MTLTIQNKHLFQRRRKFLEPPKR